jgi:hypothetical protein
LSQETFTKNDLLQKVRTQCVLKSSEWFSRERKNMSDRRTYREKIGAEWALDYKIMIAS